MLHVDETGRPDGPPMLLVHGFMSSNLQWELNVERLGAVHRLVLVEQPGHGRSHAPDDPTAYSASSVVAELERIRSALDIDRCWVTGHSMGGAIALRYGLTHPDRTRGVAFTNSRAAFGASRADRPDEQEQLRQATDLRALPYHPIHARRFPAELQQRMVEVADQMQPHVVSHVGRNVGGWRVADELGQLRPPALLVNGRWERAFQPYVAQAEKAIADLTVVHLEGGHSINIEQAEGFDRAVLELTARG